MPHIHYGDEKIHFTLITSPTLADKIRIKVEPSGNVTVSAPANTDSVEILQAVKKRSRWIYEQQQAFKAQNQLVLPRRYISGESHFYLGKRYLLKIEENPTALPNVKLLRGRLLVSVKSRHSADVKAMLDKWYRIRAKEIFAKRLNALLEQTLRINECPPIRLQTMQTQWGSCSPQGRLTLNPHLIKAPSDCIDYVILHELCHLAEHNHSERFYRLMGQVLPEWKKVKVRLDEMAEWILL
ncbi:M48 family metallopeptidase [Testudinibacter sp. TR-2022]|uniref:M48 family metallopeptidase n=1 Tax=Testudinibacter sp. TR-2022 TaxID=2585029 RepID=UPI00111AA53E|nr:SprT family zinc-dependent metalloprotease [Testudinibacter sp. TR-2022]TNH09377.1 M48 family metallopeptidase [Pasteurellaceae bacterium Phil11]TNH24139.1 M48 family metallopeptidase [Testudinibacter sp. TR-2022]TNH29403.1 M48 family metallopeptidase [Testudinibacter sp. TR-2022]